MIGFGAYFPVQQVRKQVLQIYGNTVPAWYSWLYYGFGCHYVRILELIGIAAAETKKPETTKQ